MKYTERLLPHLARYRREELGIAEAGTFYYRGEELRVEHILPKEAQWLGIPPETRSNVLEYCTGRGIKLHRHFHHLNSSQAFALSLFVPFLEGVESSRVALLRSLGVEGDRTSWQPEHVPDKGEGTNVDAWWTTSNGAQYFCEVKLTESEFGAAADDETHRNKLAKIYSPRLQPHLRPERLEPKSFFEAYQILRQVWHAAGTEDSFALFLYPRQRDDLTTILERVLADISSPLRERIIIVYAEDVLARLMVDDSCPQPMRVYARRLAEKYLLEAQ